MSIASDMLWMASALAGGDVEPHMQRIIARSLVERADTVKRYEEQLDGIVANAQDEEHLLMRPPAPPVPVVPFRRLRLVRAVGDES